MVDVAPVRNFRSLFLKKIDVRLPGLTVLRLRLHKHLSEVDSVDPHSHRFGQVLCYLSNGGELVLGRATHEVKPGLLAWIPAGCRHSFCEHSQRRPVCLAIDLTLPQPKKPLVSLLNQSEATKLRGELSRIGRLNDPDSMESRLLAASSALAILDIVFRALGLLPRAPAPVPGVIRQLSTLASDPAFYGLEISQLCQKVGGNPDHLSRLFKRHTGNTLQHFRDAARLTRSKNELLKGGPVSDAALRCGFDDPNYFSRWFRQQTGQSPTAFIRSSIRPPKAG